MAAYFPPPGGYGERLTKTGLTSRAGTDETSFVDVADVITSRARKSCRMGEFCIQIIVTLASRWETRSNERIGHRYQLAFPLKLASSFLLAVIRT